MLKQNFVLKQLYEMGTDWNVRPSVCDTHLQVTFVQIVPSKMNLNVEKI